MEEIEVLTHNCVFKLEPLPVGRKAIGACWLFKIKRLANGMIDRFKAQWVGKGYLQQPGIDFDETFSPVMCIENLQLLLAIATALDLEIHQMDVDTTFLNAELTEEVYIEQPEGFVNPNKLHHALHEWNCTLDAHLCDNDFKPTVADLCIYVCQWEDHQLVVIAVYVDDCMIIAPKHLLDETKNPRLNLLKLDCMANEDRSLPYHSVVGRLCYLAHSTWPNIAFTVNILSQHLTAYSKAHWSAAKHLLRSDYSASRLIPQVYCDTDWGGDVNTQRLMTGIVCTLLGALIHWSLKSQRCIALSTCEAEYNALTEAAKQSVYLHDICDDLGLTSSRPTIIYNNNQAALKIANSNPSKHHPRSKHYAVKLMYLQELIANGHVELHHHPSQDMPANALTKASRRTRIIKQLKLLGMFNSLVSIKGRVEERT
ncbi:retroelement pol polyproteinlike, putative [Acanthamoeba castellanii str. Neff]|uniref:Retroelement pol polyproteinlike, putative n=1 Tax=Acanthamoeba castellanii (strain ATCC 30010 / Neff) TaxID=1257118 RepID=L8GGW6_ACACF|nr:retroelement pol polyproteinlike, putative [Acanthamoeba castellanii str. Neff]ELR12335.1 retroelement pol polyproteinlike, putative [Acanthamoeba castellanii str. Neff]